MRRFQAVIVIAALVLAIYLGWQIGSRILANVELRDDLQDIASEAGVRIGSARPSSDAEICQSIIRKAKAHNVELSSRQIKLTRTADRDTSRLHVAVDYEVPIDVLWMSFNLHFSPSSP